MGVKAVKSEERKQGIIEALKGKPNIDARIWERIKGKKLMARQTYRNTRDGLIRDKKICKKEVGRNLWLYLPGDEALYRKEAKLDERGIAEKDVEAKEKIQLRIAHTNIIKEKVIRPWLERMKPKGHSTNITDKYFFPDESEPLFSDFKRHIKFKPDPFDELANVSKLKKEFDKKRRDLEYIILSIISQVLEEGPASFETEPNRIKEVVDFRDEYDEARMGLCKWIIELMDTRRLYSSDVETYDEIYLDFTSSVKEKGSLYEYYVHDIYCGYIRKTDLSKEKFKEKMDELIKKIIKQITVTERIENEIESLHKIKEPMETHLYNIRESLEKHLRLEIFPGDCEYYYYYYWIQSK